MTDIIDKEFIENSFKKYLNLEKKLKTTALSGWEVEYAISYLKEWKNTQTFFEINTEMIKDIEEDVNNLWNYINCFNLHAMEKTISLSKREEYDIPFVIKILFISYYFKALKEWNLNDKKYENLFFGEKSYLLSNLFSDSEEKNYKIDWNEFKEKVKETFLQKKVIKLDFKDFFFNTSITRLHDFFDIPVFNEVDKKIIGLIINSFQLKNIPIINNLSPIFSSILSTTVIWKIFNESLFCSYVDDVYVEYDENLTDEENIIKWQEKIKIVSPSYKINLSKIKIYENSSHIKFQKIEKDSYGIKRVKEEINVQNVYNLLSKLESYHYPEDFLEIYAEIQNSENIYDELKSILKHKKENPLVEHFFIKKKEEKLINVKIDAMEEQRIEWIIKNTLANYNYSNEVEKIYYLKNMCIINKQIWIYISKKTWIDKSIDSTKSIKQLFDSEEEQDILKTASCIRNSHPYFHLTNVKNNSENNYREVSPKLENILKKLEKNFR